jgi:hypothetical protein
MESQDFRGIILPSMISKQMFEICGVVIGIIMTLNAYGNTFSGRNYVLDRQ